MWKHSAMEVLPLTEDMRYFSDYYKACTDLEVGWCNIPNKNRLNPTEMMIAAYHNKKLVYAYKGIFKKLGLALEWRDTAGPKESGGSLYKQEWSPPTSTLHW